MSPPGAMAEFTPRGAASALWGARDGEVLLSGPAGTGKSVACLWRLHVACLMNPGMRALIVRKTLASLGATALVTWREKVATGALTSRRVRFFGGSAELPPQYQYRNGSVIVLGGMDNPLKVMSSEYDLIYVQEAVELTETDWESLTTRLRNGKRRVQQIIADTNPSHPQHWLKRRADRGDVRLIESRHEDNPLYYDASGKMTPAGEAYIVGKLDKLTGVRKARLRYGKWVAAEGMIYDEYDPAVHLVDQFEIPEEWPRYWSIDFGYTNPFVCQWWASDPDGRLYRYREVYMTNRTVDDHAKTIINCVSTADPDYVHPEGRSRYAHHGRVWSEPRPVAIICDHDAEGRAVLAREVGIRTTPAHKAVSEGIQAVQARLKRAGDGRSRLYLCRDALVERDSMLNDDRKPLCTEEELPAYVWDTSAGKPPKEVPRKEDDHGMDAMRYIVAHRDLGGRPRVRTM